jgi:uncharacterized protein
MPLPVTAWLLFVTILQGQAPVPDQKAHAASVIVALVAKDFASVEVQFDEKMQAALPPGRLAAAWNALLAQAGAFKRCGTDIRVRTITDKQMVITPCEFERAPIDLQLAFASDNKISGFTMRPAAAAVPYTAPPYYDPSTFTESDVTVGASGWPLPGTLSLPNGAGPFPAVVLVHGSGPADRDEAVGANKPFKDLALGLASRGVAVLRYEKRTKVFGARMSRTSITVRDETIDDAVAALAFLRTQPRIDPARVFILGHSLGGMLVPRILAADAKAAGAVVMAGAARPLEQAILEQTRYLAMADGTISPAEQAQIDEAAKLVDDVKALTPADAAAGKSLFNVPASYWLDLRDYDAPSAAKAVKVPMLILQGERDYQVTMEEFARWKQALSGRKDVTFWGFPELNHLFLPGTGKSVPSEYDQPSHVPLVVVNLLATWMRK